MAKNSYKSMLLATLLGTALALGSCRNPSIQDADAPVSGAVTSDSEMGEQEVSRVIYASLTVTEDGGIECEAAPTPSTIVNYEFTLGTTEGPVDEAAACGEALSRVDQDAVGEAVDLIDEAQKVLQSDPAVDVADLEATIGELEGALASDWEAIGTRSAAVEAALSDVAAEIKKAEKAEAEAQKKAEEKRRAEAKVQESKPKPKANSEQKSGSKKQRAPKSSDTKQTKPQASSTTSAILSATNKYRQDADAAALKANACAEKWAKKQAETQAAKNSMHHQDLGPVMKNCGATGAAENVAYGQSSSAAVAKAWFNSPGHRANMLHSDYTHMGAAVAYDAGGAPYYAQVFLKK